MKRAFSGAKQPMNNEKRGEIRPPNLLPYLILIPWTRIFSVLNECMTKSGHDALFIQVLNFK